MFSSDVFNFFCCTCIQMFTRREGGTPVATFLWLPHHLLVNGQHMHIKSCLEGEI